MRTAGFPNFYVDDPKTKRAFEDLRHVMKPVMENEMTIGRFVEVDLVSGTSKPVAHGLGRLPIGWYAVDLTVKDGDPFVSYARAKWDRETIQFKANGVAKLKIWVF